MNECLASQSEEMSNYVVRWDDDDDDDKRVRSSIQFQNWAKIQ